MGVNGGPKNLEGESLPHTFSALTDRAAPRLGGEVELVTHLPIKKASVD